jgi:hypothetical protein
MTILVAVTNLSAVNECTNAINRNVKLWHITESTFDLRLNAS